VCKTHGFFQINPKLFLSGYGCHKCEHYEINNKKTNQKIKNNHINNTKQFTENAKIIHQDKYDYSLVKYINNKTKVDIKCQIHGPFKIRPYTHLAGAGCQKCGYIRTNTTEFIKKAKIRHQDKYDYSLVKYVNSKTKVIIICPTHGPFQQQPNTHLNGCGCSKCKLNGYSKKAIKWLKYEENKRNINIQHALNGGEKKIGRYYVDGFNQKLNTIFEFHGCFWHSHYHKNCKKYNNKLNEIHPIKNITHKTNYLATKRREKILKKDYNLTVMWECEWDELCNKNNV